jgi:hypothetical protein
MLADEQAEALRRLEERLQRVSEAADRLMGEAEATEAQRKPPAAGWQTSGPDQGTVRAPSELEALIAAVRSLRDLIPPDVAERLAAAIRELLLAVRALIDWYLERVDRQRTEPPEVQDIPIQ